MIIQHLTDSIKDCPDGFQIFLSRHKMPYFQMKFVPQFVPLSPVKRFDAVFDVSENRDKRRLSVPGSERENRMGVGCVSVVG